MDRRGAVGSGGRLCGPRRASATAPGTLFVLTLVTVLALPMTIIPGLFGMNVGGIPFRDHGAGFWLAFLVAACTAAAVWFLVRTLRS